MEVIAQVVMIFCIVLAIWFVLLMFIHPGRK